MTQNSAEDHSTTVSALTDSAAALNGRLRNVQTDAQELSESVASEILAIGARELGLVGVSVRYQRSRSTPSLWIVDADRLEHDEGVPGRTATEFYRSFAEQADVQQLLHVLVVADIEVWRCAGLLAQTRADGNPWGQYDYSGVPVAVHV